MFGRPAVHVSAATLSPPGSLSLVNVTVVVCVPLAAAGGVQRTPTDSGAVFAVNVQLVAPAVQPLPAWNENHVLALVSIVALDTVSVPGLVAAELVTLIVPVPVVVS